MNRFLYNWNLKLTSLILAIALWGHVRGEVNPWEDATFRIQLLAPAPPPNLILLNAKDIPDEVKVKVTAPRLTLRELKGVAPPNPLTPSDEAPLLDDKRIYATLDFSLARPGKQTVPVKIEHTIESLGEITSKPGDIVLEFAPAATAEVSIEAQFAGAQLEDYTVDEVTVVPRRARVFGPASEIARVERLRARIEAPGKLSGELSIKAAPLEAVDRAGRVLEAIRVEPETAAVSAMLREKIARRVVSLALQIEGEPARGFKVEKSDLSARTVTVRGGRAALNKLTEITARVAVANEKAPLRRRVNLELPSGVVLVSPQEIWATVQIVPSVAAPDVKPNLSPTPIITPEVIATPEGTLPPPAE